nr:hypothetical protein [Klebsiella pneumoniae]
MALFLLIQAMQCRNAGRFPSASARPSSTLLFGGDAVTGKRTIHRSYDHIRGAALLKNVVNIAGTVQNQEYELAPQKIIIYKQ